MSTRHFSILRLSPPPPLSLSLPLPLPPVSQSFPGLSYLLDRPASREGLVPASDVRDTRSHPSCPSSSQRAPDLQALRQRQRRRDQRLCRKQQRFVFMFFCTRRPVRLCRGPLPSIRPTLQHTLFRRKARTLVFRPRLCSSLHASVQPEYAESSFVG